MMSSMGSSTSGKYSRGIPSREPAPKTTTARMIRMAETGRLRMVRISFIPSRPRYSAWPAGWMGAPSFRAADQEVITWSPALSPWARAACSRV